jgi:hypothetical protein
MIFQYYKRIKEHLIKKIKKQILKIEIILIKYTNINTNTNINTTTTNPYQ